MNIIEDRNKLVEAFINNLTDELNPSILYHFTRNSNIRGIVSMNKLMRYGSWWTSFLNYL